MKTAVIGLGSNSLRLLVADIDYTNKSLINKLRDREGIRVLMPDQSTPIGDISGEMIEKAINSINVMKQKALECGVESIGLFATSATRDANNREYFINKVKQETGLSVELLSGEEEALLSFIGTSGGNSCGMIDIGGGSTEFAIGEGENLDNLNSFQVGAVRLYRQCPINSSKDIDLAINCAKSVFLPKKDDILNSIQKIKPELWYGAGGTFTSLSAIIQNIPWTEYKKVKDFELSYSDIENKMYYLSDISIEQRKKLVSIQTGRADIVVNGMAILIACMQLFNINKIKVSTSGNLDGYIIKKYIIKKKP